MRMSYKYSCVECRRDEWKKAGHQKQILGGQTLGWLLPMRCSDPEELDFTDIRALP